MIFLMEKMNSIVALYCSLCYVYINPDTFENAFFISKHSHFQAFVVHTEMSENAEMIARDQT